MLPWSCGSASDGQLFAGARTRQTLYLARKNPWLDGCPERPVFVPVQFGVHRFQQEGRWQQEERWQDSLMAAVLADLSLAPLPRLEEILADLPAAREGELQGGDLVAALLQPSQNKPTHRVRPGLGVLDRANLFESISEAVPFLQPVSPCPRHPASQATGKNWLRQTGKLPDEVSRMAVVQTLGPEARIRILYQTEETRSALEATLAKETGGAVLVDAVPLGEWGSLLKVDGWRREDVGAAVRERRDAVAQALRAEGLSGVRGALVELDHIKDRQDPKFALRLGLAGAGMVSQFIVPPGGKPLGEKNPRVLGAARDLLRQLGILPDLPRPAFRGAAQPPVSLLGLTTIAKRPRRKGKGGYGKSYLPVLVQMHTDDPQIRVCYPGAQGWLTYLEAAIQLAGKADSDWFEHHAELNRWLEDTLLSDILPQGEAVLLVDGWRTRAWWAWLTNSALTIDQLKFGERAGCGPRCMITSGRGCGWSACAPATAARRPSGLGRMAPGLARQGGSSSSRSGPS